VVHHFARIREALHSASPAAGNSESTTNQWTRTRRGFSSSDQPVRQNRTPGWQRDRCDIMRAMPRFASATASARNNTDDRSFVFPFDNGWVVCVADGVGGMSGGGRAADLFVNGIKLAVTRDMFNINALSAWTGLLEKVDDQITRDATAGETTGVVVALTPDLLIGASCGDSQAWLSTSGGWQELTGCQHRKPRLGSGHARPQPFTAIPHGILLVGTDGLFDYARFDEMASVALTHSGDAADALVRLVTTRHSQPPDDITVVVGWLD
jgi:serine/threonine protein phosphatase PrpC